jgi:TPR repeat protein
MYAVGEGAPQNYAEALKWYRLAADRGHAEAQLVVGLMYYKGTGVPQNYAEAVKWLREVAEQGSATGQIMLGYMYELGRGVAQNYVQAHMWSNLAAANPGSNKKDRDVAVLARDRVAGKPVGSDFSTWPQ